jgi:hypothetical protein
MPEPFFASYGDPLLQRSATPDHHFAAAAAQALFDVLFRLLKPSGHEHDGKDFH